MYHFQGLSADYVWKQALQYMHDFGVYQDSRDQSTREMLHTLFTIDDPRQRIVFSRPINPAFAIAEVIWILSGSNDVRFLHFWNPRMMRFSDDKITLHGAYGYRLGIRPKLSADASQQLRHDNKQQTTHIDQIKAAYEALAHTPHSRQVVLQIWDSTRDLPGPQPRSKDIPCNLVSHLLIRDGKLDWLQVMRSNDLIWGTPYNFIQFTTIQEILAGWLKIDLGTYTHLSNSLHIYERHWQAMESLYKSEQAKSPLNKADLRLGSYSEWEAVWSRIVNSTLLLTRRTQASALLQIIQEVADLPPAYLEWMHLLTAEALRRRGHASLAEDIIKGAGSYYEESWKQWAKIAGVAE
jgi:thymidylate synthase